MLQAKHIGLLNTFDNASLPCTLLLLLPDMAMETHMEAAVVLFLDILLDDNNVDATMWHRTVNDIVEAAEMVAALSARQHTHSHRCTVSTG